MKPSASNPLAVSRRPASFCSTAFILLITVGSSMVLPSGIADSSASSFATCRRVFVNSGFTEGLLVIPARLSEAVNSKVCNRATLSSFCLTITFCFATRSASGPPPFAFWSTRAPRPASFHNHFVWFSFSPPFRASAFAAKCSPIGTPSIRICGPMSVPSGLT